MEKHHNEIAKEKLKKKQDVTVCTIVDSGLIYKGGFYSDCYFEDYEGAIAFCIEVEDFLHLFLPNGEFACAIRMEKYVTTKGYRKALNRILK